jgi:hypothetical protein
MAKRDNFVAECDILSVAALLQPGWRNCSEEDHSGS